VSKDGKGLRASGTPMCGGETRKLRGNCAAKGTALRAVFLCRGFPTGGSGRKKRGSHDPQRLELRRGDGSRGGERNLAFRAAGLAGLRIAREYAGQAEVWHGNSKTSRESHRERNGAARRLFPALTRWANFCRAYGAGVLPRFDLCVGSECESAGALGRQFFAASRNLRVRATGARRSRRGVAQKFENFAGTAPREVPSSLPLAGSKGKLALCAVCSQRSRAGLTSAAPALRVHRRWTLRAKRR
jgi:hypothetical protein